MPPTDFPGGSIAGPAPSGVEPEVVQKALETFAGSDPADPQSLQCRVAEGPTVTEILRIAAEEASDLLVIGTHGRRGFDRLLLGSVAEAVLHKAGCPVLTVPAAAPAAAPALPRRLLVAIDFSPASALGLEYALSLAEEGQSDLCVLHVNEWPAYPPTWYESAAKTEALRQAVIDGAREELRRMVPAEARDWCRIEELVVTGKSHEGIVQEAREHRSDLIVMGVHGRAALSHLILGSTANQVVRHADCAVLTVRA
jgi:nucleotide-binding universal stress UspA family protein